MRTFLPLSNIRASAGILDDDTLEKQHVEARQVLDVLLGINSDKKLRRNPVVLMWKGYEDALKLYHDECLREWARRGYETDAKPFFKTSTPKVKLPWWMGMGVIHASHRSNLIKLYPEYYAQFNWREPKNLKYVYPKDLLVGKKELDKVRKELES